MNRAILRNMLRERFANTVHFVWSKWMVYLFSKCTENSDGSYTIPSDLVDRWLRQTVTEYADLSEQEKESDRHQADLYLKAIEDHFNELVGMD